MRRILFEGIGIAAIGLLIASPAFGWTNPTKSPTAANPEVGPVFAESGAALGTYVGIGAPPHLPLDFKLGVTDSGRFVGIGSYVPSGQGGYPITGIKFVSSGPWEGFFLAIVNGAATLNFSNDSAGIPGGGNISFRTGVAPNVSEKLRVTDAGYVGVGTSTPRTPLEVEGGIMLENTPQVGHWNSRVPLQNQDIPVPGSGGRYLAMTFGNDGLPNLAYYDGSGQELRFKKCMSPDCNIFTDYSIGSTPGVSSYDNSLVIGDDGKPVIAYNTASGIAVAKCSDANCTPPTSIVQGELNSFNPSIRIGTDGKPVIAYYNIIDEGLKVVQCFDAPCTLLTSPKTVDTDVKTGGVSLAIGYDGNPAISYYHETNKELRFARCGSIDCDPTAPLFHIEDLEFNMDPSASSITIGKDGLPIIAYGYNQNFPQLGIGMELWVGKCGSSDCSSFASTTVDALAVIEPNNVGLYPSITLGVDGLPMISYEDDSNQDYLKIVKCGDPACANTDTNTISIVSDVNGIAISVNIGTAITIGSDGLPIVGYRDDNNNLRLFRCGNDRCIPYWTQR